MDSVNRIIRARDYSLRYGGDGSVRGFIDKWRESLHKGKGITVVVRGLGEEPRGKAVKAYIHQGQWVAECECGGHEFADPDERIFFCWSCVNRLNDGYIRPVEFPENWEQIEEAVLARPVNDIRGATELERAGLAQAAVVVQTEEGSFPLVRSWKPDESLDELKAQNSVLSELNVNAGEVVVVELISTDLSPAPSFDFAQDGGVKGVDDGV